MSSEELKTRISDFFASIAKGPLGEMDPSLVAVIAACATAIIFCILYFSQRARIQRLEVDRERLTAVATRAKEILATAPDGLFLWDHILGGITCSRRLAVLLNLEDGTHARYDDIRSRFEGDSLQTLERNVSALRSNGSPFGILLTSGKRTLEAVGARAETDDGQSVADIVWMRDVSEISTGDGADATGQAPTAQPPGANASGLDDRHLTALLDAMPIPIWLRDSGLRIAFVNHAAQGVVDEAPAMAEKARQQGHAFTERRLLDVDNAARLMDVTEIPLGAQGGAPEESAKTGGTVGFAVDRTEREEAEGELKRQTQARDAVLETLSNSIAIFTADKRLDFCNPAFVKFWDLDAGWLRDKPEFGEILEKLRERRQLPEVADFRAFKAERLAQFNAVTVPVQDLMHLPDGRTIKRTVAPHADGGLIFAYDDMSQQLGLERSMKEQGAVQRETLDNLHEGVAVYGSDGRLTLFNPVYAQLWNLDDTYLQTEPHISDVVDRSRALTPPAQDNDSWTDDAWRQHRDLVVARLLSRAQTSGQIKLTNGTVVDQANVPLPDGAVLLSYLDVTDSARVEGALRQQAKAFQEADKMKTEFIANVSYQVRTPLNTVIGFADMLSQNLFGELNPRQSEYTNGILTTSRTVMSILGDILDLTSIETGRLKLEIDTFDVHAFLVTCLNLIQERARHRNLKVEFDCPPDIGWMIADEKRLKQVIFNLLSNAITFTPPHGSLRLEARRQGSASGGDIVITVADTGVGIPAGERERVFQPFKQGGTKPPEATDDDAGNGPGLGLSIARNFVGLHGGTIDIKSMPGRGTTVTCRIPAGNVGGALRETDGLPELNIATSPQGALDDVRRLLDEGDGGDGGNDHEDSTPDLNGNPDAGSEGGTPPQD